MKITPPSDRRGLRIAILGSTYLQKPGGPRGPVASGIGAGFAARGHKVTIIAPAYLGLKDHEIDGVKVRRFRYAPARWEMLTHGEGAPNKLKKNPILKLLSLTYLASGVWAAWKICREERIDVLHVHWPFPHGLMALLPGWFLGCKVVYTCHSAEFALAAGSELSTSLLAFCLRRSFAITANSTHTAGLVRKVCGREAQIVPWGATIQIDPAAKPIPQEVPLLLFSRTAHGTKIDFLLRAMPAILSRQKVRLVITGDGHFRQEWERLARSLGLGDAVTFAGFVSNAELSSLFRSCTIYVHPAIHDSRGDTEGQGVVLVEALSNRRPSSPRQWEALST